MIGIKVTIMITPRNKYLGTIVAEKTFESVWGPLNDPIKKSEKFYANEDF